MTRRLFLAALGMAALPSTGRTPSRVVGILDQWLSATPSTPPRLTVDELRALGHREPHVRYEWRQPAGSAERLERSAAELVSLRPDAILCFGSISSRAAWRATSTIPIVAWLSDPDKEGLASASLAPLRNVTGFVDQGRERLFKGVELLKSMIPAMDDFGILAPADDTLTQELIAPLRGFAAALGVRVAVVTFRHRTDIERGVAYLAESKVKAALAWPSPGLMKLSEVVARALTHRMALIAEGMGARYGQLLTFSPEIPAGPLARQVDKVLRGVPVARIPFERPKRFILHVNRRTAAHLGIPIPREIALLASHIYDEWEESPY